MRTDNLIHVAIADDQVLFRECLTTNLKNFDNIKIVAEVNTGRELIDWIASANPSVEVILVDLMTPEMNGLEAPPPLHKNFPKIKIIVLSVKGNKKYEANMVNQGINEYMEKNTPNRKNTRLTPTHPN